MIPRPPTYAQLERRVHDLETESRGCVCGNLNRCCPCCALRAAYAPVSEPPVGRCPKCRRGSLISGMVPKVSTEVPTVFCGRCGEVLEDLPTRPTASG